MEAFAFEFMGMVLIGLCLVVLAIPSAVAARPIRVTSFRIGRIHDSVIAGAMQWRPLRYMYFAYLYTQSENSIIS